MHLGNIIKSDGRFVEIRTYATTRTDLLRLIGDSLFGNAWLISIQNELQLQLA